METMHQYQHPCDVSQCAAVPHPVPDIRGHVAGVGEGRHVADDLLPVEGVDVVPGGGQHRGQGQPVGRVVVHPAVKRFYCIYLVAANLTSNQSHL